MGSGADYKNIQKLAALTTHLFVVNGIQTSGKDSFVDFIEWQLRHNYSWSVRKVSSIDQVKEAALLLGWDGIKDEKGRKFLSDLKDLSTIHYDGPMQSMRGLINNFTQYEVGALFFMIREPTEISKFVAEFPKAKTILVKRDGIIAANNHADQNVENYTYDITIFNNEGLSELRDKARLFSEQLAKGELLQREY